MRSVLTARREYHTPRATPTRPRAKHFDHVEVLSTWRVTQTEDVLERTKRMTQPNNPNPTERHQRDATQPAPTVGAHHDQIGLLRRRLDRGDGLGGDHPGLDGTAGTPLGHARQVGGRICLDPGVDPIAEADRRGSIMAILRIGNLDLQLPGQGMAMQRDVTQAQFSSGSGSDGFEGEPGLVEEPAPYDSSGPFPGEVHQDGGYQGEVLENGYDGRPGRPQGMPTSGFAPQAMPPHRVSGMTIPQWGMPHVGTPIGLPGPPHIPLGHAAGLTSHSMRNRTRVRMPPPVHKMSMTVKQRPGMNYPRPVNHVDIAETNRAGFRAHGGTLAPALPTAMKKMAARFKSRKDCPDGSCE